MTQPAKLSGILETALYCKDLKAARGFYQHIMLLELVGEEPRRHLFFRCGSGMLLIFNPAMSSKDLPGGQDVPTHGSTGPGHAAFAIEPGQIDDWKEHLALHGVEIEREINWPNGAHSIYFRDPANNSLELATPSLWQS